IPLHRFGSSFGNGPPAGAPDAETYWAWTMLGMAPAAVKDSLRHIAHELSESMQHTGLGLADSSGGRAQLCGDGGRGIAIDGHAPKHLPGAFGELAARDFHRFLKQVAGFLPDLVSAWFWKL